MTRLFLASCQWCILWFFLLFLLYFFLLLWIFMYLSLGVILRLRDSNLTFFLCLSMVIATECGPLASAARFKLVLCATTAKKDISTAEALFALSLFLQNMHIMHASNLPSMRTCVAWQLQCKSINPLQPQTNPIATDLYFFCVSWIAPIDPDNLSARHSLFSFTLVCHSKKALPRVVTIKKIFFNLSLDAHRQRLGLPVHIHGLSLSQGINRYYMLPLHT